MKKSCQYCGRIHDKKYDCGKRPKKDYSRYKRTEAESRRYSHAFRIKSEQIKERSHYLCAYCLHNNTLTYDGLETHHIIKLRDRPDLLLDDSNLICLCIQHHKQADDGRINAELLRELARRRDEDTPPAYRAAENGGYAT